MKSHVKAVVIGGGVVGCSVLYHLARAGWTDIMLIERSELTSGSSWHAAGGFHTLNGDPNVAKLQAYTVQLYKELEEISGQSCSLHLTGGVMMADTPERMDFLRLAHAKGRYLGMDTELITPSEAKAMFPLMDETQFRRRHVGPGRRPSRSVRHHASPIPRRRKKLGAEIVLRNRVVELTQEAGRHLERHHRAGHGEGRACRQLRRPVGARGRPHGRRRTAGARHGAHVPPDRADAGGRGLQQGDRPRDDRRARLQGRDLHAPGAQRHPARHLREGLQAVVAGQHAVGFRPRAAAARPRPHRAVAGGRLQAFPGHREGRHQAGHQRPLHLRARRQPAGRPGAGPDQFLGAPARVMAGFSQGGGVGLALSNWMVNGDPGFDVWGMDVARCGEWATPALHQRQGARELFAPLLDPLPQRGTAGRAAGADHAALRHDGGAERRRWAIPGGWRRRCGSRPRAPSRRTSSPSTAPTISSISATRCAPCASGVGVTEIANFAKYEVSGAGRGGLPQPADDQPHAEEGPHRADPDAQRIRQADRRLHHRQDRRREAS